NLLGRFVLVHIGRFHDLLPTPRHGHPHPGSSPPLSFKWFDCRTRRKIASQDTLSEKTKRPRGTPKGGHHDAHARGRPIRGNIANRLDAFEPIALVEFAFSVEQLNADAAQWRGSANTVASDVTPGVHAQSCRPTRQTVHWRGRHPFAGIALWLLNRRRGFASFRFFAACYQQTPDDDGKDSNNTGM